MAEKLLTVTETIEKVKEDMCSNYCKLPEKYTEEEWEALDYAPCEDCPLGRL